MFRGSTRAASTAALAFALTATPAWAQDSHYWAEQYGTRASLLGGALIGSVRDLSSTYYNPGAAALHQEAAFVLSGRAFRQGTMTIENGAGEGLDLSTSSQRPIATLLATPIRFDWLGRHVIVYSALTRQQFDADVSTYSIEGADALPPPGTEAVAGAYRGSVSMRDTWTGLTWAYPLTDHLGIGVSQFLAIRNQSVRAYTVAQILTAPDEFAVGIRLRNRYFKHYRTLTKVGVSLDLGSFSAGLTVTTPSIALKGDGSAGFNRSISGVDTDGDGVDDVYLAANVQSGLKSDFKSSWAVGAGLGLQVGSTRLHGSLEWFDAVDAFTALDAEDFTPQTGGESVVNDLTARYEAVLNWGVGIEQPIGGVMVYGGLATDRSAGAPGPVETDMVLTKYDLWRYSGGASFSIGRAEIMLGIGYARGSQPFPQVANLDDLGGDPASGETDLRLVYTQWTVVLGLEIGPAQDDTGNE